MYTCIAILLAKVCMTRCGVGPGSIHAAWRVRKVRDARIPIERLACLLQQLLITIKH